MPTAAVGRRNAAAPVFTAPALSTATVYAALVAVFRVVTAADAEATVAYTTLTISVGTARSSVGASEPNFEAQSATAVHT